MNSVLQLKLRKVQGINISKFSLTNDLRKLGSLAARAVSQLVFLHARLSSCLWSRGRGSDNGTTMLCWIIGKSKTND